MPERFGLPVSHSLWVPLPLNDGVLRVDAAVRRRMFGRLAEGVDISGAQAELDALAARTPRTFPDTDRLFRPVVKPYVESMWSAIEDSRIQTMVLLLGQPVLRRPARAVRRQYRDARVRAHGHARHRNQRQDGARREPRPHRRSAVCRSARVVVDRDRDRPDGRAYALQWVKQTVTAAQGPADHVLVERRLPRRRSLYARLLALFAAPIVGVIPALKATGPRIQERLKHSTGASASGLKFGGVWTGVIVTQVGGHGDLRGHRRHARLERLCDRRRRAPAAVSGGRLRGDATDAGCRCQPRDGQQRTDRAGVPQPLPCRVRRIGATAEGRTRRRGGSPMVRGCRA